MASFKAMLFMSLLFVVMNYQATCSFESRGKAFFDRKTEGVPISAPVPAPIASPPAPLNCTAACIVRCAKNDRQREGCHEHCGTCCVDCGCVPSGTYGNKDECPCYRDKLNKKGGHKCP